MKVLIVCSYREHLVDGISPFISEQCTELELNGIEINYFLIQKKGVRGYLQEFIRLNKELKRIKPDLIHAHGGFCGTLANIQRQYPVVTTYHGSDINNNRNYKISMFSLKYSKWNIFVSSALAIKSKRKSKFSIIPCGVNNKIFKPMDKKECREYFKFDLDKIYILFSKAFHVKVKNYPLAKAAVDLIENAELVELKGYSREEVAILMNACDVALMTSFSEGSPQFVKEAIACGCPVVSTDVGDVGEIAKLTNSIYLCDYNVNDVVSQLQTAFTQKVIIRESFAQKYGSKNIAQQIEGIYKIVFNER